MNLGERQALLRKYRQLASWRAARDAEPDSVAASSSGSMPTSLLASVSAPPTATATRADLRALSEEFPGCLRELDVLGGSELRRRVAVLGVASTTTADGAAQFPDWMIWVAAYHRLMRAALTARKMMERAERAAGLSGERLAQLRGAASVIAGDLVDEAFIRAVAAPPAGRLSPLVLGVLAERYDVPAAMISNTLFPPRRPPPYRLD